MTVKIDGTEPNIFPVVEGVDVRDAGRNAEVVHIVDKAGRLSRFVDDPETTLLAAVSAVWSFETGWAAKAKWLPRHILVLHAEIHWVPVVC